MWDALSRGPRGADDPGILQAILAFEELRRQNEEVVATVAGTHGAGGNDMRAMSFIDGTPDATPKQVADFLGFTTGATTTLLDRLERGGYLARKANPLDRRSLRLELTDSGRLLLAGIWGIYATAFARAITGAQAEEFTENLRAVSRHLGEVIAEVAAELDDPRP